MDERERQRLLFAAAQRAGQSAGFDLVAATVVDGRIEYEWKASCYGVDHGFMHRLNVHELAQMTRPQDFATHFETSCGRKMQQHMDNYKREHGYD